MHLTFETIINCHPTIANQMKQYPIDPTINIVCGVESVNNRATRFRLSFKFIWTNYLSNINKGRSLVGTKTSNDISKSNNTTTATLNVCISCSPTAIFV